MATNASFRDPVGLVRRMMTAPEPAARAALGRAALEVLAKPLDLALEPFEQRLIERAPPSDQPMLLIVGPPRSGTTFVYQTLVRRLPLSYATNLSALFPRSPISAQSRLARGRKTKSTDVRSYFGQTRGLLDANDAFHLWDRWLGIERYRAPDRLSPTSVYAMRRFFDAWRHRFPAPFVNKNNRNTDCMRVLADSLPEARFLVVRRDPLETLQSLLMARRVVQGDVRRGWGLRSNDAEGDDETAATEAVCDQLVQIEQRLRADCAAIAPTRLVEVTYADFCAAPEEVVRAAAGLVGVTPRPGIATPTPRHVPHELSLRDMEWAEARLEPAYRARDYARFGAS
jgi:hypothetical protein